MDEVKRPRAPGEMVVYSELDGAAQVCLGDIVDYTLSLTVRQAGSLEATTIARTKAGHSLGMRASELALIIAKELVVPLKAVEDQADAGFANTNEGRIAMLEEQVRFLQGVLNRYDIRPEAPVVRTHPWPE